VNEAGGKLSYHPEEEEEVVGKKGCDGSSVCPLCPNRPPVADLARHNVRYHKEKKAPGKASECTFVFKGKSYER